MGLSAELWPIVKQLQEGDQFDEIICSSLSCLMFNSLWLMHTIDADDPDKVIVCLCVTINICTSTLKDENLMCYFKLNLQF